ncbi:hypothetical protein HUW51_04610 [Adhaeribacter swui]|uniref:Lipocalin family protein n=1 Tax=Adhaeribacter swui TaxID=2086471 RepID=A0A7G7G4F9_9BACT|nr:hypothetical protein [Adhaeribacter swui]QNF32043.1 hypothetical protein HUW51_04610 [Adhaeribacter swui]
MQRITLLLLALVLTTACEKEDIQTSKTSQNEDASTVTLVGKWEWVRSDGGIAAHIHETPKSTGQTIVLEFKENNQYVKYVNGNIKSQGTYSLSTRKCIHTQEEKQVISTPDEMDMMIEKMDNNSLELSDENSDGIGSQYKRK